MSRETEDIQKFVTEVVRLMVEAPDHVRVEQIDVDDRTVLRLRVAPADIAKVIGKQCRTARSLRTILSALGAKTNRHYFLEVVEV